MERRLEKLRESMNNTVLKEGKMRQRDKMLLHETALNHRDTKKRYYIAPILSYVLIICSFLFIGKFFFSQFLNPELESMNKRNTTIENLTIDRETYIINDPEYSIVELWLFNVKNHLEQNSDEVSGEEIAKYAKHFAALEKSQENIKALDQIAELGLQFHKTAKVEEEERLSNQIITIIDQYLVANPIDDKEWKDVTVLEEGVIYDLPTNAKEWISSIVESFSEERKLDPSFITYSEAGYDIYYLYYIEAMALENALNIIMVEGVSIEKDFDNLRKLSLIMQEEHEKRTESIPYKKYDKRDDEQRRQAIEEWKEPSERFKKAVTYTFQLLHDLDIAINSNKYEEIYGVSYQADGKLVNSLELFLQSE